MSRSAEFVTFDGEDVQFIEADIIRSFERQEIARVFVNRDLLDEDGLERGETELFLVESPGDGPSNAEFGGILRDIDRQGAVIELVIESFERLTRDAVPTDGGERFESVEDTTIISDAISEVEDPEFSEGTVESVSSPITMVFSHSSQAKKIRETAASTGAEIVYRADKTFDYLVRRGEDRTSEVIGPREQNVKDDFVAEKLSADEDITHLRLVGAGEGRHQQAVSFVPLADSTDWESQLGHRVERYVADHWEAGDRFQWTTKSDKNQTSKEGLIRLGETIVEDVQEDNIEARGTLEGIEDVSLGDSFTVHYPQEDVQFVRMRIVELEKKITKTGDEYEVVLSSRRESRAPDEGFRERKDLSNYNLAFEGSPVTINTGDGRQPVNEFTDYIGRVYLPDEIEFVHRFNIRVMGLPYRFYASSEGHTHKVEIPFSQLEHRHGVDIPLDEVSHEHSVDIDLTTPNAAPDSEFSNPIGFLFGGGDIDGPVEVNEEVVNEIEIPDVGGFGLDTQIAAYSVTVQHVVEDTDGPRTQAGEIRVFHVEEDEYVYDETERDIIPSYTRQRMRSIDITVTGDDLAGDTRSD